MRRSEAAKYARWSAAVAVLLAGITGAVYVGRSWQRIVEKRHAPPAPPVNVERQSTSLTFSKVEENQTIFTVEASKSTDFRGENATLLEDVKITVFGKTGQRHDVLHTQSCRYSKETGGIACAGAVQIDLMSAAEAARSQRGPEEAAAQAVRIETKGVRFDRASGLARTDQPVFFRFPNGEGQAVGVEYRSEEGALRLLRDVSVKLKPSPEQGAKKTQGMDEVAIHGSQLDFGRDSHAMELLGPATAETAAGRIAAGEFQLLLDENFHAKTLSAKPASFGSASAAAGKPGEPDRLTTAGRPQVAVKSPSGTQTVSADLIAASIDPEGWVERITGQGSVQGTVETPESNGSWKAESAELEMWPRVNQPKELNLKGGIDLSLAALGNGESRELETEALRVTFRGGKPQEKSRVLRAETLAPGSLLWKEAIPAAGGALQETRLKAERMWLDFGVEGKGRRLEARGNVQMERRTPGRQMQTATANAGSVELAARGGWSRMELDGIVRLKEGDRSALADHAMILRAEQTATLTGHATVRDAASQTTAAKITFFQESGDVQADGDVKTSDLSVKSSAVELAPAPATITADHLQANSKSGRALYSGHARLWQGASVLEADAIELNREERSLSATGNVRAVFPRSGAGSKKNASSGPAAALWHVSAGSLKYWEKENRAHLEQNVVIQSANNRIRGAVMDLYFARAGANGAAAGSAAGAGAREISRAVATGGVIVEQGERRATADRGEYTAADGKFVMSGGNPTIFDAASGTTTGRQLTFFLADDTIIVDSEKGSRTLTKHRVE
jgi:lipopolysaccharide export system protein LptA